MIITCTNGNRTNGIPGSRVRFTCKHCGEIVRTHYSPWRGPAGYYERKHPRGGHAENYHDCVEETMRHEARCEVSS